MQKITSLEQVFGQMALNESCKTNLHEATNKHTVKPLKPYVY